MRRRRLLQLGLGGIAAGPLPLFGVRNAMADTSPETTVYVSNAGSKDVYVLAMNRETGALITGNQISPGESRIDFNLEQFDREKISDYTKAANDVVARGLEVKSYFMNREEALKMPGLVKLANALPPSVDVLRIVQIGDVDTQADGGVHVGNTREIGEIVVNKAENKGKNNRRLYFSLKRSPSS